MKNFIYIEFPENPKLKSIVIKDVLRLTNLDNLLIDVNKEENDKEISLGEKIKTIWFPV